MTLDDIRAGADSARLSYERKQLRRALQRHGWSIRGTAAALECGASSLRKAIGRHPELEAERAEKGPGRGRPRKVG
ncbi:hypothetical protein LCGC14_2720160 [marine sediment metagenome]|uniref:DNA binding HTH domain-containing protein n=1 Tax=marine sediment metagenome TaxID=412755 RepID=A0A0F8ZAE3_9ZZZZ